MNDDGQLPNSPDWSRNTTDGEVVQDLQWVDVDGNGIKDLVVAVDEASIGGHVEIWWGDGGGSFEAGTPHTISYAADGSFTPLGPVTGARMADVDGDGIVDLVCSSVDSPYESSVHVYIQKRLGSYFEFIPMQTFDVLGQITQVRLVDLVEDDQGDTDIVLAVAKSEETGGIEVWQQSWDGYFGTVGESGRFMDDFMITGGAPLSLVITHLDNDIFPDTVIGVRQSSSYDGRVEFALGFGNLLSEAIPITDYSIGAVLTMTEDDFNSDGVSDLAVGTQNSTSSGKLFVFFRQ
jgi:hypothetical protein